jgi:hypothetical protein
MSSLISVIAGSRRRFDPDAASYFSRIIAAGSTITNDNKLAVDAFIRGCKADGIWSNITQACLLAGPDTIAGAFVPLKGNTPTYIATDHTRLGGVIGSFDTQTNHTTFSKDNIHYSVWRTSVSNANHFILTSGGQTTGIGTTSIEVFNSSLYTRNQSTNAQNAGTNIGGFIGVTRNLSTSYIRRYNNGNVQLNISSIATLQNANIFSSTLSRLSFYSIGENIDLALLNARVSTYMSSIT